MLAQDLKDEGLAPSYERPRESRGAEEELVKAIIYVASTGKDALVGAGAIAATKKVAKAFKARFPKVEVEVDDSDGGTSGPAR